MNKSLTIALAIATLGLSLLSSPAQARTAACHNHPKFSSVCIKPPVSQSPSLPKRNGN
jgi:hypothetical protein